jgi:hypothetical protein
VAAVAKSNHALPRLIQKMRLAWPETAVIGTALFIAATNLLFWAILADGVGSTSDNRLNVAAFHWFVGSEFGLVLPLWLILRTIYFISSRWQRWRSRQ